MILSVLFMYYCCILRHEYVEMQQRFYFLPILRRNFLPKIKKKARTEFLMRDYFTCSSHKVIDVVVSSSIIVTSRRLESRFDVRLTNGITPVHESTIPITSLVYKK